MSNDADLEIIIDNATGEWVTADSLTRDLINKFEGIGLEDAALILHWLKNKSIDILPSEFFNKENWKFISPNRHDVLDFIYTWRYHHIAETNNEPRTLSEDWRQDFDLALKEHAEENDMFLLPFPTRAYHLCSFIFVSNTLRDWFNPFIPLTIES